MGNTRSVPPAQDAPVDCDPTRWVGGPAPPITGFLGRLAATTGGNMRLILNIIWLAFGGLWMAIGYLAAALICFLLIVTIPFGFASLRIASYALWPFGRTLVEKPNA